MISLLLSALLFVPQSTVAGASRDPLRFVTECGTLTQENTTGWSTRSFAELMFVLPPGSWQTTRHDFTGLGGQEWVDGRIKVTVRLRVSQDYDLSLSARPRRTCRAETAAGPVLLTETVTHDGASVTAWNPALRARQLETDVFAEGPPSELPTLRAIVLSARGGGASTLSCIPFAVDRLAAGQAWRLPIQNGLEVRIQPGGDTWMIDIGPRGEPTKHYEYPVSPPYYSRSHAQIGAGYNVSTRDSVSHGRFLRFVLNQKAYSEAFRIMRDIARQDWRARMADLARGQFVLRFTGYEYRVDTDTLAWIGFEGSACVQPQ